MSRLYTGRLSSNYSKQISTSRKITNWSTLPNTPLRSDKSNGQIKRSEMGANSKATCEKNNYKCYKSKIFNSHLQKPSSHRNRLRKAIYI